MSFRRRNLWRDQHFSNDHSLKTQNNHEESPSDQESVDGLTFGYLKKNFNAFKGSPIMHVGNNGKDLNKATEENEAHNLFPSDHQNAYVSYPYVESSERHMASEPSGLYSSEKLKSKPRRSKRHGTMFSERKRKAAADSFHTDAAEVQKMEKDLLSLLDDFNSGKLSEVCTTEQMEGIRDQQESLARLHFELSAKQDIPAAMSDDALRIANENMDRLMTRLQLLSLAIGKLSPSVEDESQDKFK